MVDYKTAQEAIKLIESLQLKSTPILAVETFKIEGEAIYPQMDHILELSEVDKTYNTWKDAKEFIEQRKNSKFHFEIIY